MSEYLIYASVSHVCQNISIISARLFAPSMHAPCQEPVVTRTQEEALAKIQVDKVHDAVLVTDD